jgi:hypothetical protein
LTKLATQRDRHRQPAEHLTEGRLSTHLSHSRLSAFRKAGYQRPASAAVRSSVQAMLLAGMLSDTDAIAIRLKAFQFAP